MGQRKREYWGKADSEWMDNFQRMIRMCKLQSAAHIGGKTGNIRADGFANTTYLDVAGATNLDTSITGTVKPTGSPTVIDTNNTTAAIGSYTMVSRAVAVTNGVTVYTIGLYSTIAGTYDVLIVQRTAANAYTIVARQSFSHTGGGWQDVALTAPYTVPGTGTYYLGAYTAATGSIPTQNATGRAYLNAHPTSGSFTTTAEDTSDHYVLRYTASYNNLTVATLAETLASVPLNCRAALLVSEIDTVTAGTDYLLKASRDNGAHYGTFALTKRFTTPDGYAFVTAEHPGLYGLASGSSGRLQFSTANNKNVQLLGWAHEFHPA